ncbi:MAG: hypothetical protein IKN07_01795 [Lachnospiraceae bacterium]|nr:hypothetical protein [Lachnospiraceae bacterium]MBR3734585.1 hypothetical protein [Lachnospiraceae bacterium]
MKSERSFNILTKITADWDEIDQMIKDILAADTEKVVDTISISRLDVKDGVLQDNFVPIVCVDNYIRSDLDEKVAFRNQLSILRPDMLPESAIILWERS